MMRSIGPGLAVALAVELTAAPRPKDLPPSEPEITGDWVLVSLVFRGQPTDLKDIAVNTQFTPDGRRVSRNSLGQVVGEARYALGRDQDPPTFDLRAKADGPVTSRGIYAVKADSLTICFVTDPEAPRPAKLEAPAGSNAQLAVYKRVKKRD